MEQYYESSEGSNAGSESGGGGSYSWINASPSVKASRRRRLSQQFSANAYLGHAFNACASTSPASSSSGFVDVDPSLLRYTRPHIFSSSSVSSSGERPLHLRQLLYLRSPLGSYSASPPSPLGRARTPPRRSPPLYCTPARGAVMEDGVLVINDGFPQDGNRVCAATARRLVDLGPYSTASAYGGSGGSSGGSGIFYGMERRASFEELGLAMEPPQMGRQATTYQSNHGNRSWSIPGAPPVATGVPPGMPATTHSAIADAVRDDSFTFEVGGLVNGRHSSVPGAMATKSSAHEAGMPTEVAVPDVWRRTEEEEARLHKILHEPIPPPPPSASTFLWPPSAEEAEIERVLYGPRRWRRLPVFEQICAED